MQENDSRGPPQPPGARQAPPNSGPATMRELLSNLPSPSYMNAMLTVIAACLLVLTFLAMQVVNIRPGYVDVADRYLSSPNDCGGIRNPCSVKVTNWPSQ